MTWTARLSGRVARTHERPVHHHRHARYLVGVGRMAAVTAPQRDDPGGETSTPIYDALCDGIKAAEGWIRVRESYELARLIDDGSFDGPDRVPDRQAR